MSLQNEASPLIILGLGSNLGDRLSKLRRATGSIEALDELTPAGRSRVYETKPVGGPTQPNFFNAAVAVHSALALPDLFELLLVIERRLGRARPDPIRWGPRTIDIDLLWWSAGASQDGDISIPHPKLAERAFAVQPLLDLVPDATDPLSGRRYASLSAAIEPLTIVGPL